VFSDECCKVDRVIAKVDRDVAMLHIFASVFHMYVANVCLKCFIYFICTLQQVFYLDVHIFHTYVRCCICFTHMLQVFLFGYCISFTHMLQQYISNVSSVSDKCCIEVFHVASVSRGMVSDGCSAWAPGDGAVMS
jgi:hypothetical protein